jgi:hypothetical protein
LLRSLKRAASFYPVKGTQNKCPQLVEKQIGTSIVGTESMRIWWEGNTNTLAHLTNSRMSSYIPPVTTTITEQAVKSDSADVPIHLWDDRIAFLLGVSSLSQTQALACILLRQVILRR